MWLSLSDFDHFHDDSWPKDWPNPDEKTKHVIIRATKVPNESIIQPINKQPKFINAAAVIRLTQFTLSICPLTPSGWNSAHFTPKFLLDVFIPILNVIFTPISIRVLFTPNSVRAIFTPKRGDINPDVCLSYFYPIFEMENFHPDCHRSRPHQQ